MDTGAQVSIREPAGDGEVVIISYVVACLSNHPTLWSSHTHCTTTNTEASHRYNCTGTEKANAYIAAVSDAVNARCVPLRRHMLGRLYELIRHATCRLNAIGGNRALNA